MREREDELRVGKRKKVRRQGNQEGEEKKGVSIELGKKIKWQNSAEFCPDLK